MQRDTGSPGVPLELRGASLSCRQVVAERSAPLLDLTPDFRAV